MKVALATGYLGPADGNLLTCDLTDIGTLLSKSVPEGVRKFFIDFQFKVKEPNVHEITEVLESEIEERFCVANGREFYLHFYQKMLNYLIEKNSEPFTDERMSHLFEKARKIMSQTKLIGRSQGYESYIIKEIDIVLNDREENQFIADFLNNEQRNIMVCYAHTDTLVTLKICYELIKLRKNLLKKDGSYAFIDEKLIMQDKDKEAFKTKNFKLLIIDHALNLPRSQLIGFIKGAKTYGKKLLLLTTEGNKKLLRKRIEENTETEISEEYFKEVKPLSKDAIDRNIEGKSDLDKGVMICNRFVSFRNMSRIKNYYKVMSNPYHLSVILKQSVRKSKAATETDRLFIKPTLIFQKPIYQKEAVLDIKYDVIHFDEADLSSIKQVSKLDLSEPSKYSHRSLKDILASMKKNKPGPVPEALLIQKASNWNQLDSKLQEDLKKYGKLIFVNEDIPFDFTPLRLVMSDEKNSDYETCYKLAEEEDFKYMPETSEYIYDEERLYDKTLVKKSKSSCKRIVLSDYGSGKTYLTEEILNEENTDFNWIVRLPMKTLNEEMLKWSLLELVEHYIGSLNEWQRDLLQYDIDSGEVLWVLDGFDEMSPDNRKILKPLIGSLLFQPNCLVTSRPSAVEFIPLQPNQFIAIKPFDDIQIEQFVHGFFKDNEELKKQAKELIEIWQKKNTISLLGKPLMCRIACEIINSNKSDAENLTDITLAKLFDYFMKANFRKYHHDHNGIYMSRLKGKRIFHLSSKMITRLKKVSYAKLFAEHLKSDLSSDEVLDDDIKKVGFISNIEIFPATDAAHYIFDHQTQVEYFAALYWVEQLLEIPKEKRVEHVKIKWSDELFNIELKVVWQFVAGIVSTTEDNIFLDGNGSECFEAFRYFLIDSSEDLVGEVHKDLLYCCYHNMHLSNLKNKSYYDDFKKAIFEKDKPYENDKSTAGKIQLYRVKNKKNQSDDQIVEKYNHTEPYIIRDFSWKISPDKIEKRIEGSLSSDDTVSVEACSLIRKYFEQPDLSPDFVSFIKNKMLKIYENGFGNYEDYSRAYAVLVFMMDSNRIDLEDCLDSFTKNFDQKNCVLDVVRRLNQASLLTDAHLETLFTQSRQRFWDLDAGIPTILLLKSRFYDSMARFLKDNILERSSGDWEIDEAKKILIEITHERYDYEKLTCLLNLIVELYSSEKNRIKNKEKESLERNIFTFQDVQLIKKYFSDNLISRNLHVNLQLLYRFCFYRNLALIMQDNDLRIRGNLHVDWRLPDNSIIKKFIRITLETFRINSKHRTIDESSEKQIVLRRYQDFLKIYNPDSLEVTAESNRFYHLSPVLPFLSSVETEMKEDIKKIEENFREDSQFRENEAVFRIKEGLAVLRALDRDLDFWDEHLKIRALTYENMKEKIFLYGEGTVIESMVFLDNYFGKGAYQYLKYCYLSLNNYQFQIKKTLKDFMFMAGRLTKSTAIQFFLKAVLITDIMTDNDFENKLIENLKTVKQVDVSQVLRDLSEDSDVTAKERENLARLLSRWPEKIPALTQSAADTPAIVEVSKPEDPDILHNTTTRKRKNTEALASSPKRARLTNSPLQRCGMLATQPAASVSVGKRKRTESAEKITTDNKSSEEGKRQRIHGPQ